MISDEQYVSEERFQKLLVEVITPMLLTISRQANAIEDLKSFIDAQGLTDKR